MEGKEKPHMDKHKYNTNDWNYDASYMLTSLLVSDFKTFSVLDFCCTEYIKKPVPK
jgi:hypothetical protein